MMPAPAIRLLLAALALAHVLASGFALEAALLRPLHVALVLVAVLLLWPAVRGARRPGWVDYAGAGLAAAAIGYLLSRAPSVGDLPVALRPSDTFFACALVVALAEAIRRTAGAPALALVSALGVMALVLGGGPLDAPRTLALVFASEGGVRGAAVGTSAGVLALLCVLEAALRQAGYAIVVTASARPRAGAGPVRAAMADVLRAGLLAAATVGEDRRVPPPGRKEDDGLAHATAFGAVLVPPVLGAAALLAGVRSGTPYAALAAACVVPALAYLAWVFVVRLRARRAEAADVPPAPPWTRASLLAIGAGGVLVGLLAAGVAGISAILSALAVAVLACALTPSRAAALVTAGSEGARTLLPLAVACIAASVVWTLCAASGVEARIAAGVTSATGGAMLPATLLAALVSLALGRCVPVTFAYVTGAVVAAPPLVAAGMPPLPAHLLIVLCAVTAAALPLASRHARPHAPAAR